MKLAIILTGHARNYQQTYQAIKHWLLDHHDVDIYISTWSVDSPGRGSCGNFDLTPVDLEPVKSLFQPRAMWVEDHVQHYANKVPPIDLNNSPVVPEIISFAESVEWGSFWVERIRDMYATMKRGYNLIENPAEYDLVMRLRFDAVLKRCTLKNTHDIVFPVIRDGEVDAEYYSDWTAYGTPEAMRKYCTLGDHMESIYRNDNINIGHADKLLKHYVHKENLSVLVDNDYAYYH